MAARGILTPFYIHNKTTVSAPLLMFPTFISWLGKGRRASRARFFCNHSLPEIDMPKYREKFAQRMAMAGLNPHHRIAIAVSGGPDSIALCVLTSGWKSDNFDAVANGRSMSVDGLFSNCCGSWLANRKCKGSKSCSESSVRYGLSLGIKCEVACCEWLDGRPKIGHLQEAARNKRYEALQSICVQHQIGVLLIAHHADDQAELFILRLSRNSGVFGLAGMTFTSQMFSEFPDFGVEESKAHGILLVRPLLEFTKEDMYNICQGGSQQWVEDPTNKSPVYARNRIRMSLSNLSSSIFKAELQAVLGACRRTRMHVEKLGWLLLNQTVTIMRHGYAVIDLVTLQSMDVKDIYLAKFASLVVQFISQRHRPVRGNGLKLLISYLRTFPCKTCLTIAGCYLCPAPGSKGNKILVCCSIDTSLPALIKLWRAYPHTGHSELEQIVRKKIDTHLDKFVPDDCSVPFLDAASSGSVLIEAKRLGILSDSSHATILSLQKQESENFIAKSTAEALSDSVPEDSTRSSNCATLSKLIYRGQKVYFMDRFLLDWDVCCAMADTAQGQCFCICCVIGDQMAAQVRHMVDADWLYLYDLSKKIKTEQQSGKTMDYAILSAGRALLSLKSIPVAARRSMPVLVNHEGVLLSIPSIGFAHCPHLMLSAHFHPRIPLGGGHSSFL